MTNKLNGMNSCGVESLEGKLVIVLLLAALAVMLANALYLPHAFAGPSDEQPIAALSDKIATAVAEHTSDAPSIDQVDIGR